MKQTMTVNKEMLAALQRMKADLDAAISGNGSPRSREEQRADIRAAIASAIDTRLLETQSAKADQ